MTSTRPTKYQAHHRPTSVHQIKCDTAMLGSDNRCVTCGRYQPAAVARGYANPHVPNTTGSLGYTLRYADGSTRYVAPGEPFSRP